MRLAAVVAVVAWACSSPSMTELAFDRAICIELEMEASRCDDMVRVAAGVVPDVAKVDGVGTWPADHCVAAPCPSIPPDFVAYVTFHFVDDRPSVAVQVRDDSAGGFRAALLSAAETQALGVPR